MPKLKATPDDKNTICARLMKGASYADIAHEFNLSARTIRRIEEEQHELEMLELKRWLIGIHVTWFGEEKPDPQIIRFWLERVYAKGVRIPKNENQKRDTYLWKSYCLECLAHYRGMSDAELLNSWTPALVDAAFAFHPKALDEDLSDLI